MCDIEQGAQIGATFNIFEKNLTALQKNSPIRGSKLNEPIVVIVTWVSKLSFAREARRKKCHVWCIFNKISTKFKTLVRK